MRRDGSHSTYTSFGEWSMIRAVLTSFELIVLAAAVPGSAQAQFYKGKTITMIVNYPAGGPTDLEGRIVALHLRRIFPAIPPLS